MLSKEEILARRPKGLSRVEMPEWGGTIYVREMSAAERDGFESRQAKARETGTHLEHFRAKMVVATACDESGKPLFDLGEVVAVSQLPLKEIHRIFNAALKINAISDKEAEDLEKNS